MEENHGAIRPLMRSKRFEHALDKGYPVTELESNPDFDGLKAKPEFQSLIAQYAKPTQ